MSFPKSKKKKKKTLLLNPNMVCISLNGFLSTVYIHPFIMTKGPYMEMSILSEDKKGPYTSL